MPTFPSFAKSEPSRRKSLWRLISSHRSSDAGFIGAALFVSGCRLGHEVMRPGFRSARQRGLSESDIVQENLLERATLATSRNGSAADNYDGLEHDTGYVEVN